MKDQEENIKLFSNFVFREAIEDCNFSLCNKFLCANDSFDEIIKRLYEHEEVCKKIIVKIIYANSSVDYKNELIKSSILSDNLNFLKLILNHQEILCYLCIAIKCNAEDITKYILNNIPVQLIGEYIEKIFDIIFIFVDIELLEFVFNYYENSENHNFKLALENFFEQKCDITNYFLCKMFQENIFYQINTEPLCQVDLIDVRLEKTPKYILNMLIPPLQNFYNYCDFLNAVNTNLSYDYHDINLNLEYKVKNSGLRLFDNLDNLE